MISFDRFQPPAFAESVTDLVCGNTECPGRKGETVRAAWTSADGRDGEPVDPECPYCGRVGEPE